MHKYNIGALFQMTVIDVAGLFAQSDQGDQYVLVAMDYISKYPKPSSLPTKRH
jgi:hypothetical protein